MSSFTGNTRYQAPAVDKDIRDITPHARYLLTSNGTYEKLVEVGMKSFVSLVSRHAEVAHYGLLQEAPVKLMARGEFDKVKLDVLAAVTVPGTTSAAAGDDTTSMFVLSDSGQLTTTKERHVDIKTKDAFLRAVRLFCRLYVACFGRRVADDLRRLEEGVERMLDTRSLSHVRWAFSTTCTDMCAYGGINWDARYPDLSWHAAWISPKRATDGLMLFGSDANASGATGASGSSRTGGLSSAFVKQMVARQMCIKFANGTCPNTAATCRFKHALPGDPASSKSGGRGGGGD